MSQKNQFDRTSSSCFYVLDLAVPHWLFFVEMAAFFNKKVVWLNYLMISQFNNF
jgi:hypothetical protein